MLLVRKEEKKEGKEEEGKEEKEEEGKEAEEEERREESREEGTPGDEDGGAKEIFQGDGQEEKKEQGEDEEQDEERRKEEVVREPSGKEKEDSQQEEGSCTGAGTPAPPSTTRGTSECDINISTQEDSPNAKMTDPVGNEMEIES